MRTTKTKKLLALILALVMLVGSVLPVAAADADAKSESGTKVSLQELTDEYSLISYEEYKKKYDYTAETIAGLRTGKEVTVAATDYLEGDHYFRIHREGHNLDRCHTQIALVEDMEKKWDEMQQIVAKYR